MIHLTTGNLLESSAEALVNTVNTVGVMGKGVALQFKKAFPENFKAYEKACKAGAVRPGSMFITEPGLLHGPRFVINFPTKEHWKGKSRMEHVEAGLASLVEEVRARHIRSIAIPPLGCGLGGLPWPKVRERIERAFAALPDVEVLLYEPQGAPAASRMVNRTARPEMNPNRAAFIMLIREYLSLSMEQSLTLLEVQKGCYFLQLLGQSFSLNFEKGPYGPYADNLRHVLNMLEGHYISGWGAGDNKPFDMISLLPGAEKEATPILAGDEEFSGRLDRLLHMLLGFESPYGMELLGTVHWVAQGFRPEERTVRNVEPAIRSWTTRKADLFTKQHIAIALDHLGEHRLLELA